MNKRTDIHRPSAEEFDPQAYEFEDAFDLNAGADGDLGELQRRMEVVNRCLANGFKFTGVHGIGRCSHCGAGVRYAALMLHADTKGMIWVGEQCLGNRFSMTKANFQTLRKNASLNRERRKKSERLAEIVEAMSDEVRAAYEWAVSKSAAEGINPNAWGEGIAGPKDWEDCTQAERDVRRDKGWAIAEDIARKIGQYTQPLSPKQEAFIVKLHGEFKGREAKRAEEAVKIEAGEIKPVPTGKATVTGEVASVKWIDSEFGGAYKMLVISDEGFKVYGSVPSSLKTAVEYETETLKGRRVQFNGTFEPKDNEPTFGFFSRPTKAKLLEA